MKMIIDFTVARDSFHLPKFITMSTFYAVVGRSLDMEWYPVGPSQFLLVTSNRFNLHLI